MFTESSCTKKQIYNSYLICPNKKRFKSTIISQPFKGFLVEWKQNIKTIKTNFQTSVDLKVSKTIHCDFQFVPKGDAFGKLKPFVWWQKQIE